MPQACERVRVRVHASRQAVKCALGDGACDLAFCNGYACLTNQRSPRSRVDHIKYGLECEPHKQLGEPMWLFSREHYTKHAVSVAEA